MIEKIKMENLFIKLKIINDLSKIILKCLTKSQNNLLNEKLEYVDEKEIIKYDSKLMIKTIKNKNKNIDLFDYCAKYGKLENMKWLLENKFPYDEWTFN
jgi:hypothetical protein